MIASDSEKDEFCQWASRFVGTREIRNYVKKYAFTSNEIEFLRREVLRTRQIKSEFLGRKRGA